MSAWEAVEQAQPAVEQAQPAVEQAHAAVEQAQAAVGRTSEGGPRSPPLAGDANTFCCERSLQDEQPTRAGLLQEFTAQIRIYICICTSDDCSLRLGVKPPPGRCRSPGKPKRCPSAPPELRNCRPSGDCRPPPSRPDCAWSDRGAGRLISPSPPLRRAASTSGLLSPRGEGCCCPCAFSACRDCSRCVASL